MTSRGAPRIETCGNKRYSIISDSRHVWKLFPVLVEKEEREARQCCDPPPQTELTRGQEEEPTNGDSERASGHKVRKGLL